MRCEIVPAVKMLVLVWVMALRRIVDGYQNLLECVDSLIIPRRCCQQVPPKPIIINHTHAMSCNYDSNLLHVSTESKFLFIVSYVNKHKIFDILLQSCHNS